MNPSPQVSVVIPLFNRAELIRETLDSLRVQTLTRWEAIVVDDGSTDAGPEVVQEMGGEDPRIRFLRRSAQQKGASVCRNEGLNAARADFVVFLDSDDCLAPHCLARRAAKLNAHPELAFAVFGAELFESVPGDLNLQWNVPKSANDLDRFLGFDVPWSVCSPIWRKQAIQDIGGFLEELKSWQDWELHVRALARQLPYLWTSQVDCFIRIAKSGRPSISQDALASGHLQSRQLALHNVIAELKANGQLDKTRAHYVCRLAWQLCRLLVKSGDHVLAKRVWRELRAEGLMSVWCWREIMMLLRLQRVPGLRFLSARRLRKHPVRRFELSSNTFNHPLIPRTVVEQSRRRPLLTAGGTNTRRPTGAPHFVVAECSMPLDSVRRHQ